MSIFQEVKVKVKNTFLELVEDVDPEVQPGILRAQTDSKALRRPCFEEDDDIAAPSNEEARPASSAHSLTVAAAVMTASVVKAAAQAVVATAAAPQRLEVGMLPLKALGMVAQAPPHEAKAVEMPLPKECTTECASDKAGAKSGPTTVMLRNLPNDYTRDMLLELLASKGLAKRFDFVYVPMDFTRCAGLGYAFTLLLGNAHFLKPSRRLRASWASAGETMFTLASLRRGLEQPDSGPRGQHRALPKQPGDAPGRPRRVQASALCQRGARDFPAADEEAAEAGGRQARPALSGRGLCRGSAARPPKSLPPHRTVGSRVCTEA
mmetsp:Transcript_85996/g.228569  ORF Transcript_85996/g.228569 Transcript_85996/m.228569 type:complete len:322 (-) Transcript_85996:7-972(-)